MIPTRTRPTPSACGYGNDRRNGVQISMNREGLEIRISKEDVTMLCPEYRGKA